MTTVIRRPDPGEICQVCQLSKEVSADQLEVASWWLEAAEGKAAGQVAVDLAGMVGGSGGEAGAGGPGALVGYGAIRGEPGFPPETGVCRLSLGVTAAYRRQGIGDRILAHLLQDLQSCKDLRARVRHTEQEAISFLVRRGFSEFQRMLFLVQELESVQEWQAGSLPPDVTVTTLSRELVQRPECLSEVCDLQNACLMDIPSGDPFVPLPLESFARTIGDPLVLHDCFFLAKAGGRYVGLCYAGHQPGQPEALRHRSTGVLREYRRNGIATALKREVSRYALRHGFRQVITSTLEANRGMRAINEALGFRFSFAQVRLRRLLQAKQ